MSRYVDIRLVSAIFMSILTLSAAGCNQDNSATGSTEQQVLGGDYGNVRFLCRYGLEISAGFGAGGYRCRQTSLSMEKISKPVVRFAFAYAAANAGFEFSQIDNLRLNCTRAPRNGVQLILSGPKIGGGSDSPRSTSEKGLNVGRGFAECSVDPTYWRDRWESEGFTAQLLKAKLGLVIRFPDSKLSEEEVRSELNRYNY